MFCLACADIAVVRGRRVLGVPESERVTLLWKETVKSVIQKEGQQFDADSIIRPTCARSVTMLMKSLLTKKRYCILLDLK